MKKETTITTTRTERSENAGSSFKQTKNDFAQSDKQKYNRGTAGIGLIHEIAILN